MAASRLVAVVVRWSGVVVALLVVVGEPRRTLSLLLMTESSVTLMKASVTLSVVAICEMEAKTLINSSRRDNLQAPPLPRLGTQLEQFKLHN